TPNKAAAEALPLGQAASDVFSYTIADAQGQTSTSSVTFNITGQNDAPTASIGGGLNATEQVALDLKGKIVLGDVDGGATTETVTLTTGYGKLHLDAGTSAVAISGNDSGSVTVTGTLGQLGALFGSDPTSVVNYLADTDTPPASASLTVTISDSHGAGNATTGTIAITAIDDAAVAVADTGAVVANSQIANATLFGNDHDPDGPALQVGAVNGVAGNVGTQIVLGSGALLTVRADGTYDYDPNHAFDTLSGATGASNSTAIDSFTYTLAGGNTATVTITVQGSPNSTVRALGTAGDDTITGTSHTDVIMLNAGGHDHAAGGDGNDGFYFGAAFDAQDQVDGGAGTLDQIGLQGDYSGGLTLGQNSMTGVEMMVLLPGSDTRFGDTGANHYSYNITTVDANVAAGQLFYVQANTLRAGENLTFDGSAETDGSFNITGGLGVDHLIGGQKDDYFYFGDNGRFGASDTVDGQGGSNQLRLQGDYSGAAAVTFGAGQMAHIDLILLASAADTRFGAGGAGFYSYDLTMDNANVAAGDTMTIQAKRLVAGETLTFNGSAETDGHFKVYSGSGNDTLKGGALSDLIWANAGDDHIIGGGGADQLYGCEGNDTFVYTNVSDSTAAATDVIFDYAAGDKIDLSAIGLSNFIGSGAFDGHAGEVRVSLVGGVWHVDGDTDGDGNADLSILVHADSGYAWSASDFTLAAGGSASLVQNYSLIHFLDNPMTHQPTPDLGAL
ncbi:MAG: Ig-like domain-containing protein, partial [Sphingomonas sp.]|uniref:Ig-like domain-containing protein n=1 Tax=Sphingomonas sp. TaxID=28214 RepID=UPI003F806DDA